MLAGWHASCLGHFSLVEKATSFTIEISDMPPKNCSSDLILIYILSLNDIKSRLGERSHFLLFLWPIRFDQRTRLNRCSSNYWYFFQQSNSLHEYKDISNTMTIKVAEANEQLCGVIKILLTQTERKEECNENQHAAYF